MSKHAQIQSVRPSDKAIPEQLETSTAHNGKDHTRLVTKARDAKNDPSSVKRAKSTRFAATNDPKGE